MNSTPIVPVPDKLTPAWHQAFLEYLLPRVVTHARYRFRDLPAVELEEAVAEATATALVFFVRLVDRGRNPIAFALRIARIAVLRVKAGRLIGSRDRSRDPLSRFARQRHGFEVASLDDQSDQTGRSWQDVLTENRKVTPAETAASRIDFSAWLGGMTQRRRQIALSLAAGHQTVEVAREFHLSSGRVSQLRREFEASWNEFQRDVTETSFPSCQSAA
jgi:hypothetical protein